MSTASLPPDRRTQIAKDAAAARWAGHVPKPRYEAITDHISKARNLLLQSNDPIDHQAATLMSRALEIRRRRP